MSNLDNAILLIRQGRKEEAIQILEPLIRTEPNNIQAWFWYVETCSTVEKRIQILEVCQKMNPGNSQVMQALQTLRSQLPAQALAPFPVQPPKPASPSSTPYSANYDDKPKTSTPPSYTSTDLDNAPVYTPVTVIQQSSDKPKNAWEEDNAAYVDTSMLSKLSKPKSAARSYAFYDVWMTVLTSFDNESYEDVLNDPEAGIGRAFEWVAYSGIISGLILPFSILVNPQFKELMNMPEFKNLLGNMSSIVLILTLAIAMAIITPIFSVIGLALGAAIQNFLAISFGGKGYYGRTVYALAAFIAPMTIISTTLGVVPLVGQCLTSAIGFYNIVLNVRALRAAHSISIWQALGVMFLPSIVLGIFGCLLIVFFVIPNIPR